MNEKYKNTDEEMIDLSIIFGILLKHVALLIVMTVLGSAAAFTITRYMIAPKYQATATVIVNNKASDTQYLNNADITSAKGLAELYSIIIKSDTVLEKIVQDYDNKLTYEQLRNSVKVETLGETQVVQISMVSTDPDFAKDIVGKFAEYSKPVIKEKVDAGSVKDLNAVALSNNGNPISPNKMKNTAAGGLFGFVLAAGLVILKELLNTTLKTEADVTRALNVPLLGVIPMVDRKEFRS